MDATFKKVIKEKIANGSHIVLELKKAKTELLESTQQYKEVYHNFKKIEDPTFEQKMEEADSWGNLFKSLLFYDEVKMYMGFKSEIEIMLKAVKIKLELDKLEKKND